MRQLRVELEVTLEDERKPVKDREESASIESLITYDDPRSEIAAPNKKVQDDLHCLTHIPADPENCDVCAKAKMRQKAARRVKDAEKRTTFEAVNEQISVDLVDPGERSVDGARFLMTTVDSYSGELFVHGVESKSPLETKKALLEDVRSRSGWPQQYRTDNGGEWMK